MTNLAELSREMQAKLRCTGQPQQHLIQHPDLDRDCVLILRYGPERRSVQVVTVIEARQPPTALREEIQQHFDIPHAKPDFDYHNGYGIAKWTWSIEQPPQPVQGLLFDLPDPVRTGAAYYQL